MYDDEGNLSHYPVEDEHVKSLRTKSQKGSLPNLVEVGNKKAAIDASAAAANERIAGKKGGKEVSPKDVIFTYIKELISEAASTGEAKITARANRKLQRMMMTCVDVAAKDLLHAALEKFAVQNEKYCNKSEETMMSPERVMSSTIVVTPPIIIDAPPLETVAVALGNEAIDVDSDDEDDLTIVSATTADEFLAEMKEEVILQTLLHKRIHEKSERVFELEHRNGRRLLVVLPPDSMSIASFVEEANKTKWIDIMLNSQERVEGMLTHLAKAHPDHYTRVGQKRDLSMRTIALNTPQTVALARVGRLNDVRLKRLRSFLKHVGNVNVELSASEVQRIDNQVAWHRTKETVFGSCLHEWSLTKRLRNHSRPLVSIIDLIS
jgi:hypothetical protein